MVYIFCWSYMYDLISIWIYSVLDLLQVLIDIHTYIYTYKPAITHQKQAKLEFYLWNISTLRDLLYLPLITKDGLIQHYTHSLEGLIIDFKPLHIKSPGLMDPLGVGAEPVDHRVGLMDEFEAGIGYVDYIYNM